MDLKYYNINSQLSKLINRILEELCKTCNYSPEVFSDKNKEFLIRYSILKDISSVNKLLNELEEKPNTYDAFFEGNRHVKFARDYINDIYSRYISTPERKEGFESFENFLEWWFDPQNYLDGKKVCHYCGIDEDTAKEIFVSRTISSKSLRTRGSPPVRRIFLTPHSTAARPISTSSSTVRMSPWGRLHTPPSGIQ